MHSFYTQSTIRPKRLGSEVGFAIQDSNPTKNDDFCICSSTTHPIQRPDLPRISPLPPQDDQAAIMPTVAFAPLRSGVVLLSCADQYFSHHEIGTCRLPLVSCTGTASRDGFEHHKSASFVRLHVARSILVYKFGGLKWHPLIQENVILRGIVH